MSNKAKLIVSTLVSGFLYFLFRGLSDMQSVAEPTSEIELPDVQSPPRFTAKVESFPPADIKTVENPTEPPPKPKDSVVDINWPSFTNGSTALTWCLPENEQWAFQLPLKSSGCPVMGKSLVDFLRGSRGWPPAHIILQHYCARIWNMCQDHGSKPFVSFRSCEPILDDLRRVVAAGDYMQEVDQSIHSMNAWGVLMTSAVAEEAIKSQSVTFRNNPLVATLQVDEAMLSSLEVRIRFNQPGWGDMIVLFNNVWATKVPDVQE